jgi:2-polyprenyl-6-methoxyphenol hydroxylase-like FAD-dependent oxidoreductase
VLAGELFRAADHPAALAAYEQFMRPHVATAQNVRPAVLRRANPRTRAGIRALHTGARLIASPPVRAGMSLAGKTFGSLAVEKIALPDYSLTPV